LLLAARVHVGPAAALRSARPAHARHRAARQRRPRPSLGGLGHRLLRQRDRRPRAHAHDRGPPIGLVGPRVRGRAAPVRRPRPLLGREPLPARAGTRLGRLTTERCRRIRPRLPVDLRLTMGPLRRGRADPTIRFGSDGAWRAARTPDGPATVHLRVVGGAVEARAWGPGAAWALDAAPDLVG